MKHDPIADVFSILKNTENIGKKTCEIPNSRLIRNILKVMQKRDYIGDFKETDSGKGIEVNLRGKINDCNVIKPNFSVKKSDIIKFEKRYLPANNIGILIMTTSSGIMDQQEAAKKGTGGRLLGYVY
ncbi:MAG: 30S ribosomal protein S8 [Candidatus Aenigmatarchaeota archaeon]|nr:MAG: 30S ribosomal protein S8 [Candidatus Aenigmarchaeota archaeon]